MLRIYVKVPPAPVEVVVVDPVKYGLLYNNAALSDTKKITSSDSWVISSESEMTIMCFYIDPSESYITNKIRKIGAWDADINATDNYLFSAIPCGCRYDDGEFSTGVDMCFLAILDNEGYLSIRSDATDGINYSAAKFGVTARPMRDATKSELLLPDGPISATYTGNDGKVYRCCKIGTQIWLADNLAETMFRNLEYIPGYDGGVYTPFTNSAWAALTTGALCAYNNDWSNV